MKNKILLIDIETFPIKGYAWEAYETNLIKIIEPTVICCWSAKWLGGKQITKALCDYKGYKPFSRDDKNLCQDLWELMDEAEVIVAHNGNRFDIKKINYRFITHRMKQPSPYKAVDTLREYKKVASADIHKLGYLAPITGAGEKLDAGGVPLWLGCEAGDDGLWKKMKKYNANDVTILEPFYVTLRPWMKTHPNMATPYGPGVCIRCGSTRIHKDGIAYLTTGAYQQYQCANQSCGKYMRDTQNLIEKENKPYVNV